ncbi:hypothetical protein CC2G_013678 [Coprinopsis cinerea AmutBmut pab1-1]|nr:hypothetical protein CC2G_013678 [Coprinopsis cinerea AmutBmut pab1-1]
MSASTSLTGLMILADTHPTHLVMVGEYKSSRHLIKPWAIILIPTSCLLQSRNHIYIPTSPTSARTSTTTSGMRSASDPELGTAGNHQAIIYDRTGSTRQIPVKNLGDTFSSMFRVGAMPISRLNRFGGVIEWAQATAYPAGSPLAKKSKKQKLHPQAWIVSALDNLRCVGFPIRGASHQGLLDHFEAVSRGESSLATARRKIGLRKNSNEGTGRSFWLRGIF